MLWQLFPAATAATFVVFALSYLIVLCIDHFDSYYGIDKRKKKKFVFWGLKILEFSAIMFIIETSIKIMMIGRTGGFFLTAMKLAFSVLISLMMLALVVFVVWLFVLVCKGLIILIKRVRKDIVGDIKKIFGFMAEVWADFVQANKEYAEVIAEQGVIHSIVYFGELKWEVGWMRRRKLEEEQQREKERKEMSDRCRQAEKDLADSLKPTIKPLWYP